MNPGDPGLETWKDLDAARHGGGHPWMPGVYDPETQLYIIGTGNPTPAYTSKPRGEGLDNLFTCSLVAINVDTGKMAWYYQTSPHDTHDWDSAQTPILVDGEFGGAAAQDGADRAPQRLLLHARSPDRRAPGDQQVLRDGELGEGAQREGAAGARSREGTSHRRRARVGRKRRRDELAAAGVQPGHRPVLRAVAETYAMYYLTETDPRGAMGLGGKDESQRRRRRATNLPRSTTRPARPCGGTSSDDTGAAAARRAADDGGQAAVRRRRVGQLRRVRSGERQDAVAHRGSARCRTRRRPTCSTAASTCSSRPATRCMRLRSIRSVRLVDHRRSGRIRGTIYGLIAARTSAHDALMEKAAGSQPSHLSRRAALKAIGAGIGTVAALPWLSDEGMLAFVRIQETNAAPQLKVLSPTQFATLEVLVGSDHSGRRPVSGAKQARVVDYIDLLLSESDRQVTLHGSAASRRSTPKPCRASVRRSAGSAPIRWTRSSDHQPQRAHATDAARDVLRDGQAGHRLRLLHIEHRHSPGVALQGQCVHQRVRRVPDRRRQGLSALRAENICSVNAIAYFRLQIQYSLIFVQTQYANSICMSAICNLRSQRRADASRFHP